MQHGEAVSYICPLCGYTKDTKTCPHCNDEQLMDVAFCNQCAFPFTNTSDILRGREELAALFGSNSTSSSGKQTIRLG
jgi:predicted amidophosphoribosyltransferase